MDTIGSDVGGEVVNVHNRQELASALHLHSRHVIDTLVPIP